MTESELIAQGAKRIDALDAATAVAKQLPDDGVSFREFVTRIARLRGDCDEAIEATIRRWEQDGGDADDIVKIGPQGRKLN